MARLPASAEWVGAVSVLVLVVNSVAALPSQLVSQLAAVGLGYAAVVSIRRPRTKDNADPTN
jgi:hypothetical protein